jgi:hypothetical protein
MENVNERNELLMIYVKLFCPAPGMSRDTLNGRREGHKVIQAELSCSDFLMVMKIPRKHK